MLFTSTPSRRHFQRWATLLLILCIHVAMLWMFRTGSHQQQIKTLQYLSIFNVSSVEKSINNPVKPPLPSRNERSRENTPKTRIPEAISNVTKIDMASTVPSTPSTEANTKLDLDTLRGQAVQIERSRTKSDIEKMNDSKKLNLSLEATFDREVNQIILPECRQVLLGKNMPERMRIIQDHSKKKFCRATM
jgi:hypothetical protein